MAKILIIEDNSDNMMLSVLLLRKAGHTVLSASDAEAGLMLARTELPDLILMDIQLPGMDGLEATAMLKGDDVTRAIPVLALTALAMKGDEERIRAAGCDGYIAKPMSVHQFLAVVAAHLSAGVRGASHDVETPVRTNLQHVLVGDASRDQAATNGPVERPVPDASDKLELRNRFTADE